MKTTKIKCPITGDFLLHVGSTSNDLVHIYEAENNRGFRYKRYRLDWTVFELSGGRFFSLDNDVLVEVQKVGDKWMLLSATEEEKEKVLSDYRERQFKLMLDMRMPEQSGLELFRELRTMGCEPPVVFLSGESQTQEAIHSLKEGAIDFLLKPVEYDVLLATINHAIDQASHAANGHDSDDMRAPFDQLTLREKEVMRLVLQGMRGQKIADTLGITLRTVKMHRSNLMNKVGAEGVTHLLALYHQAHP
jgi:FixJ family two-component response regulator